MTATASVTRAVISRITRGRRLDEELVFCDASHIRTTQITFKVTSCSDYSDQSLPTYFDLLQQAWILQPASRKRPAGFVRASDLRDEELLRHMADLPERQGTVANVNAAGGD